MDHKTTIGEIPYGEKKSPMTVYHFQATGAGDKRPVILAPCGYDSTAEAGYSATAYMALKHGFDCITWDGPGQGGMLYEHRVPMRPDFEAVLPTVVDWVVKQPGIDPARIAIFGRSYAGYLAPRGVIGEPRIAALVCDPGQYDLASRIVGKLLDQATWEKVLANDPETEAKLQKLLENPHRLEYFGARMATTGTNTVGGFLRQQPEHTLQGKAHLIKCPVLLTEGEADFAGQSQELFDALTGTTNKKMIRFPVAEGAGGHCGGLGATQIEEAVFDWLAEMMPAK